MEKCLNERRGRAPLCMGSVQGRFTLRFKTRIGEIESVLLFFVWKVCNQLSAFRRGADRRRHGAMAVPAGYSRRLPQRVIWSPCFSPRPSGYKHRTDPETVCSGHSSAPNAVCSSASTPLLRWRSPAPHNLEHPGENHTNPGQPVLKRK